MLQPSARLNVLIAGVLALARERFEVRIYGFTFLSNHFHMMAAAASSAVMSAFMCFVMSNIAREAGRLQGWSGHFRVASEQLRERLPELGFSSHAQVMAFTVPETG